MNRKGMFFAGWVASLLIIGCSAPEAPRHDEIDYPALNEPCACLEAAAVLYNHTSDLVLEIKRISDETRRRTNLGEPTSDALLDSMLMMSEQLRADLDGPGRQLDAACEALVDFEAIGQSTASADCPQTTTFQQAFQRLQGIKTGVQP